MNKRIEMDRPIIESVYSQNEPNQPIDIGQAAVGFDFRDTTYSKEANVTMDFLPDHKLNFTFPFDCIREVFEAVTKGDQKVNLSLAERNVNVDCFWKTHGGNMVLSSMVSAVTVTQPSASIAAAMFHIFNFPDIIGPESYVLRTGEPPLQGAKMCGKVTLKADGWIITITATDRTDQLDKQLKAQGGYVITHVGQIIREDGATFTSAQLDDILACLTYFLSFTLGRWTSVDLPIGFDGDGNRVFERWGIGRTARGSWNSFCSWFHPQHGELLSQVFPGFLSLWKNSLWNKPLIHALYWYIGACKGGTGIGNDTGLILAQTALDLLAWNYCIKDRKMVSPRAFSPRKLAAADKLRLLASSMGIPTDIPPSLSALNKRPGKKWDDGMEMIASIRNSLVHPDSDLKLVDGSYTEAYRYSLWFLNLVFLRLCNHHGRYANKLPPTNKLVTFDKVPWAKNDSGT